MAFLKNNEHLTPVIDVPIRLDITDLAILGFYGTGFTLMEVTVQSTFTDGIMVSF